MQAVFLVSAACLALVGCNPLQDKLNQYWLTTDIDRNSDMSISELMQIFLRFDTPGAEDGEVTQTEFMRQWVGYGRRRLMAQGMVVNERKLNLEAWGMFAIGDRNRNGIIEANDIPLLYNDFDIDGNGRVDREEYFATFTRYFCRMSGRCPAREKRDMASDIQYSAVMRRILHYPVIQRIGNSVLNVLMAAQQH